jgi:hypothetical protein
MNFKVLKRILYRRIRRYYRFVYVNIRLYVRSFKLKWKHKKKIYLIKYSIIALLSFLTILALRTKIQIVDKSTHTKEIYIADTINTLEQFLFQLRYIESSNNHKARRKEYIIMRTSHGLDTVPAYSQYIGFYQMGYSARKVANMHRIPSKYWKSERLQHKSVIIWLIYLKKDLSEEILKWNRTFYGGFYVTESGILGMSHLVGNNATKRWLNSGRYDLYNTYRLKDGNGKNGTDYLQQLGRYHLKLERFLDEDGEINYDKIDKFVDNIMENKTSPVDIIELQLEDSYIIIDSVDIVKDSIVHKIPKIN